MSRLGGLSGTTFSERGDTIRYGFTAEDAPHASLDLRMRGGDHQHTAHLAVSCGGAPLLVGDEDGDAYRRDESQRASNYAQRVCGTQSQK